MTTALLERPARRVEAARIPETRPQGDRPTGAHIWLALLLAILFHVGVACLVLPGVPGSPVPAIAPLAPKFSAGSTSVELVEAAPAGESRQSPQAEEQKVTEPAAMRAPMPSLPQKPLVGQHSNRHPAHARQNRTPALGGGLVLSEPPYPLEARQKGLEGKVTLQVFVQDSHIVWVEVLASSGHAILDGSAKQWALRHWRFPGIASGAFTEAVVFSLDGV